MRVDEKGMRWGRTGRERKGLKEKKEKISEKEGVR